MEQQNLNEEQNQQTKPTYDPTKGKEVEDKSFLPKDEILDGVIIDIKCDIVKNMVDKEYLPQWKGNLDSPCIEVSVDVPRDQEKLKNYREYSDPIIVPQIFTYEQGENGEIEYSPNMNLGKFKDKYKELPSIGLPVKISVTKKGFGKINLE